MGKFKVVTELFNSFHEDDTVHTEKVITDILNEANILQYDQVQDMPKNVLHDILAQISKAIALNPTQEQDVLDFFKEILVNDEMESAIIAKSLRYFLRKNKRPKFALVVVDVQNDFISGSLALRNTPGGQEGSDVVPVINNILDTYSFDVVFYSLDWHPLNHCSYITNVSEYTLDKSSTVTAQDAKVFDKVVYDEGGKVLEQVLWPVHCLQHSEGAQLHSELKVVEGGIKIYKGQLPNVDSYSALWDNGKLSRSEMIGHLFDYGITHVFTCGLATDFCVGMTSLDAAELGFDVFVIDDACRGVADDTIAEMKDKMVKAGCELISSEDIQMKMNGCAVDGQKNKSSSKFCNLI